MHDYIPREDASKIPWLFNLARWLIANGTTHGFTPTEISSFFFTVSRASADVRAADTVLATAIAMARDNAQRLQNDPNTTNADRVEAGITIQDTTKSATSANEDMTNPRRHPGGRGELD